MDLLPPEIVHYILEYLHYDKDSLEQCSLLCRSWTFPAQSHLFYSIHIVNGQRVATLRTLNTISPFIREITISAWHDETWLNDFVSRLPSLPLLQQLTLKNLQWSQLSAGSERALFKCFQTLEILAFIGAMFETMDTLKRVVSSAPRLRRICVIGAKHAHIIESEIEEVSTTFYQVPNVEALKFNFHGVDSPTQHLFTEWIPVADLQILEMEDSGPECAGVYLERIGSSLKHVKIRFPHARFVRRFVRSCGFSRNHQLQSVTLDVGELDKKITDCLRTIHSVHLRTVSFTGPRILKALSKVDNLEATFMDSSLSVGQSSVIIQVTTTAYWRERLSENFLQGLPKLNGLGRIRVLDSAVDILSPFSLGIEHQTQFSEMDAFQYTIYN